MTRKPAAAEAVPPAGPQLEPGDFDRIAKLAYDQFGLTLAKGKEELVKARLASKMRKLGISSFRKYVEQVRADPTGGLLVEMIDALATNHTSFLREPAHFDFLRDTLLPAWRKELARHEPLWIWSAACSSGEEPYSIAMWLAEHSGEDATRRFKILATDISTKILAAAQRGIYSTERLAGVPVTWRNKYFQPAPGAPGNWQVSPAIRGMVEFQRLNLVENFRSPRMHPLIFCRNVMIYFDPPTQQRVVTGLAQFLMPGGYLFVGHSESLSGLAQPLKYQRPAIYRKP